MGQHLNSLGHFSEQPRKSNKATYSATNVSPKGNLKPKLLNSNAAQSKEVAKKKNIQKKIDIKVRGSYNRNPTKNPPAKQVISKNTGKKAKKQAKGQLDDCNGGSATLPVGTDEPVDVKKKIAHEDKENTGESEMSMDVGIAQEI
ncbi:hypothetical protein ABZP36_033338 [Zizania latifolia]